MKRNLKTYFILTAVLIFGGSMMAACTASEKTADGSGSAAGGTEQVKSADADNKQTENKSDETKKAEKEILYDFRKTDNSKRQEFPKAETDVVLKYLSDTDSWDKDLAITSRVSGSFTKASAKETLYFVAGCKGDDGKFVSNATCGHAGWNTDGWIAIYDGTTPVMKINSALGYGILKIIDVNSDGIDEILSSSGYAQSGIQFESVSLSRVSDSKLENIKTYRAYIDNCAFGDTAAGKMMGKTAIVSYVPATAGKTPEFTEEYFQATCKDDQVDNSSWKTTTKTDFEEFFDKHS